MADQQSNHSNKKIVVSCDGPYFVVGDIPMVRKTQVVSENGEPLTWKKGNEVTAAGSPALCRCGHSHEKPFCDGTHCEIEFDGTETAVTNSTHDRRQNLPGTTGLIVRKDAVLCMESGFCANRLTSLEEMLDKTDDPNVRSQVIAMVERCPSGTYTYALAENEPDLEPDLPFQVAITTEMMSEGPIMGPLWVTGGIPVERSDGQPFETRNRVALCRCGLSKDKPLCDGAHRTCHVVEDNNAA